MDCGKQISINQTHIDNIREIEDDINHFTCQLDDINKQIKEETANCKICEKCKKCIPSKKLITLKKEREGNKYMIRFRIKMIKQLQRQLLIC